MGGNKTMLLNTHILHGSPSLKTVTAKTNFEDTSKTQTHHHSHTSPINPHTLSWLQFDISDTEE